MVRDFGMSLDVIYVGNAIVDMVARCDDAFLSEHDIDKGGMNLIDEDRAIYLSQHLPNPTVMAGGSAANSAVGMALLGGKSGYVGEVAQDELGSEFIQSLRQTGTQFLGKETNDGLATARSMIVVTSDAIRSMNTFLGACIQMGPHHLDDMPDCDVYYLEGYLFDAPHGPALFEKVAQTAAKTGAKLALSLSVLSLKSSQILSIKSSGWNPFKGSGLNVEFFRFRNLSMSGEVLTSSGTFIESSKMMSSYSSLPQS